MTYKRKIRRMHSIQLLFSWTCASMALQRSIPKRVLVGYAHKCEDQNDFLDDIVKSGVNVVIWAFLRVDVGEDDEDKAEVHIRGGPDHECLSRWVRSLEDRGYGDVLQLASFGGWNAPHIPDGIDGDHLYSSWIHDGYGEVFHGFDWDLEGNDVVESPRNFFSLSCLDAVGRASELARANGYIVTMAPPESYLDFTTDAFSRYVNGTYAEGRKDFSYHGANVYAYLLERYPSAFDLIMVQLYESDSHSLNAITADETLEPWAYVVQWLSTYLSPGSLPNEDPSYGTFRVRFSMDPTVGLPDANVSVPYGQLVLGLSSTWASQQAPLKHFYMSPTQVGKAYNELHSRYNIDLRGFMFWDINPQRPKDISFVLGLNDVLNIRQSHDYQRTFQFDSPSKFEIDEK